jgi:hypothetical protein
MAVDFGTVAISGVVALTSTLLTNWWTPRFGHTIWKRQRKQELRLAAIDSLIAVTSDFYMGWLNAEERRVEQLNKLAREGADVATVQHIENREWEPEQEWYIRQHAVNAKIKALFSESAFEVYRQLENRFNPDLGPTDVRPNHSQFQQAYEKAFDTLYREVFDE